MPKDGKYEATGSGCGAFGLGQEIVEPPRNTCIDKQMATGAPKVLVYVSLLFLANQMTSINQT